MRNRNEQPRRQNQKKRGVVASRLTGAGPQERFAVTTESETPLLQLAKTASSLIGGASSTDRLFQILCAAREMVQGEQAGIFISPNQQKALLAQLNVFDLTEASEISLGPQVKVFSSGPLAKMALRGQSSQHAEYSDTPTQPLLPLVLGDLVIDRPKVDASTGERRRVLQVLADLAAIEIKHVEALAELRAKAQALEKVREQLLIKNMKLRERSVIDDLTGLYNRQFFQRSLAYELDRFLRYRHSLGVILFDIDHFKSINDSLGHKTGDQALKHLADIAKICVRGSDLLARYGGEEFVVLLPDTDAPGTAATVERLLWAVENNPLKLNDHEITMTISAGITALDFHFQGNADQVMGLVDDALYRAKAQGRNCVVIADADV